MCFLLYAWSSKALGKGLWAESYGTVGLVKIPGRERTKQRREQMQPACIERIPSIFLEQQGSSVWLEQSNQGLEKQEMRLQSGLWEWEHWSCRDFTRHSKTLNGSELRSNLGFLSREVVCYNIHWQILLMWKIWLWCRRGETVEVGTPVRCC